LTDVPSRHPIPLDALLRADLVLINIAKVRPRPLPGVGRGAEREHTKQCG
jgi:hypothetical protein